MYKISYPAPDTSCNGRECVLNVLVMMIPRVFLVLLVTMVLFGKSVLWVGVLELLDGSESQTDHLFI